MIAQVPKVVAATEGRQVLRLLGVAAELGERGGAHVVDLQADADGRGDPAHLLDGHRARQVPEVRAAVLGRRDQAEDADLAEGLHERRGELVALLHPLDERRDRLLGEFTDRPPDQPHFPGQIEIHGDLVR